MTRRTPVDEELDRSVASFTELLRRAQKHENEVDVAVTFVEKLPLTQGEIQAWIQGEPDFPRRIISPLDTRRKVTTLRSRREGTSPSKTALSSPCLAQRAVKKRLVA